MAVNVERRSLHLGARLLLVALMLSFAGNAQAVLLTQVFEAAKTTRDTSLFGSYAFNPFDASLGILQTVSYGMQFEGSTNTNAATCDGTAQAGPDCTGRHSLFVNLFAGFEPSAPFREVRNLAQTDNLLSFHAGLDEVILRGWSASRIWSSEFWDLSVFESQPFFSYDISMLCTNQCLDSSVDWSGQLSATLTYDYVPAPAAPTSVLLVLGLALVSRLRRFGARPR